jgi:PAS domain S-box-containing protein
MNEGTPVSTGNGLPDVVGSDRLRALIDNSMGNRAIFTLDLAGNVASWNTGAERIFGFAGDEILGLHVSRLHPRGDGTGGAGRVLDEAAAIGSVEESGWWVRRDGSTFWAEGVVSAIREAGGLLVGFGELLRDATERRRADEETRDGEQRFRRAVESVKDYAIFMVDREGQVQTWNHGAELIKGYRSDEIIGRNMEVFYPPEDRAAGRPATLLATAELRGRVEDEGWRLRKDGTRFWADVVLTAVHDGSGRPCGFAKVTRDLSERRKAEDQRLRLSQAHEEIRLRDDFLSIVSHELKTPLTAMQLQLELLGMRLDTIDSALASTVERVTHSGDRLASLIDSLLDVSRIATGRLVLKCERFDAARDIEHVVEGLRPAAGAAGCELDLHTEESLEVTWDRVRIDQVVMNLLSNAIKYGAGGPIAMTLAKDGDAVVLEIRDHGPGIPEEDLTRIFGRFERAASMRHYGGLGLGLYVAREIVEAHAGTVHARNLPGGACFTVRLPVVPEVAKENARQH